MASGYLTLGLGALPDSDFCGRGRIKVVRKGRYHPVYLLRLNGTDLAELDWHGPRRIYYRTVDRTESYELKVGPMKRKIRSVDGDGNLSKLIVSSNHNLARRELRVQMPNGDNFIVRRRTLDRWGSCRFEVRKQHYVNSVLIFNFDQNDSDSPILVDVERLMKWELPHLHRLLSLVTARIGLEQRMMNNGHC